MDSLFFFSSHCCCGTRDQIFGTASDRFPYFWALADTDGQSLWSSIQNESPLLEPDYSSIEQLFCLPVADNKDKNTAAPVKKVSKEVCEVNTGVEVNSR